MLGLVHGVILGLAPPQLASLLPVHGTVTERALRQRPRLEALAQPADLHSSKLP